MTTSDRGLTVKLHGLLTLMLLQCQAGRGQTVNDKAHTRRAIFMCLK